MLQKCRPMVGSHKESSTYRYSEIDDAGQLKQGDLNKYVFSTLEIFPSTGSRYHHNGK